MNTFEFALNSSRPQVTAAKSANPSAVFIQVILPSMSMLTMASLMQLRIPCVDIAGSRCRPNLDWPLGARVCKAIGLQSPSCIPAIVCGWNGTKKKPHVTSVKVSVGLLRANGNSSCRANAWECSTRLSRDLSRQPELRPRPCQQRGTSRYLWRCDRRDSR